MVDGPATILSHPVVTNLHGPDYLYPVGDMVYQKESSAVQMTTHMFVEVRSPEQVHVHLSQLLA